MENSLRVTSADAGRWEWYAAGDCTIAPQPRARTWRDNDSGRVFFEIGLSFAVPLALAVVATLLVG